MRWDLTLPSEDTRVPKLLAAPSLESILCDIRRRPILCCHEDQISGTSFKRVAYSIDVGEELFDLFFNSWGGYRAAFYRSPFDGLRVNRLCLDSLESALLDARAAIQTEVVQESLRSGSAKIWLAERGKSTVPGCPGCEGEWEAHGEMPSEIFNDRWELSDHYKAKWGRRAPRFRKLKVFGAFLDQHRNEFVPNDKRFRAEEISAFGWA
jgi:hypothetical protein